MNTSMGKNPIRPTRKEKKFAIKVSRVITNDEIPTNTLFCDLTRSCDSMKTTPISMRST